MYNNSIFLQGFFKLEDMYIEKRHNRTVLKILVDKQKKVAFTYENPH